MTTIYSWYENGVTTASGVSDGDMVPVYPAGVGPPQILPISVLQSDGATPVNVTSGVTALSLTQATHGNRTVTVGSAAIAVTLPASSGSGARFKLLWQISATATSSTVKVANSTDIMQGVTLGTSTNAGGFATTATSDTVSLNGAGTGGTIGTMYEFEDVKTGFWLVRGRDTSAITQTPYSATV